MSHITRDTGSTAPGFNSEFPYERSIEILQDFASYHARQAGPYRESILRYISRRDWVGLLGVELDPELASDPLYYYHARQAVAFFEKLEALELGVDKEQVAWTKFQEAESACRRTNATFRLRASGLFYFNLDIEQVLTLAQWKIARILGGVPGFDELKISFGPGANTSVKASASSPRWKLGAKLACSAEAVPSIGEVLHAAEALAAHHATCETEESYLVNVEVHEGRLQFVPKNAKTYRSIVVEPLLNSLAQKGIGSYLRDRLRRVGVDLNDQTRNQQLARKGSVDGSLATVDLSSASDTISKEIVSALLPLDWYSFLSRYRTGRVTYRGASFSQEKFSSMGNAFTFELESLLFYALAHSVCRHLRLSTDDVSVYGDDIIVPVEAFPLLCDVLNACGFSVNAKKSFASGHFRESCGKDYLHGIDVRPYYQKKLVSPLSLFVLHNYYMRCFDFESARAVLKYIPVALRLYGPDGYGDGHLIGSWEGRQPRHVRRRGWEGSTFDTYALTNRVIKRPAPGDYILPGYSIYVRGDPEGPVHLDPPSPTDHFVVRGVKGYKRLTIYTLRRGIFT